MRALNFLRILLIAAALTTYSAWARNAAPHRPHLGSDTVPAPDGIPIIHLAEAETLWHRPTTIFLDVRPLSDYLVGHIEGALHLPYDDDFAEHVAALRPRLERAAALVVYCKSVDCGKSEFAAIELHNAGLSQVIIYPNGWYEWVRAGLPAFKAER